MKKFFFISFIFFTFCSAICALDSKYLSFRITPRFELTNGTINEYVFNEECRNTDDKLSQLDWDVKTIPTFGIRADIDLLKYIYIGIDGSVGVPKKSGNMQDYDWLNYKYWPKDDPTEITNYSIHENYLLKYMTFSVGGGVNIKLPAKITLTPMMFYYYDFFSFDGKYGYKTYKEDNWKKINFSGMVISYKQEINDFLLGLAVRVETLPKAFFYADFLASPNNTNLNALDFHYINKNDGTGTAFWDNFSKIWQLQTHAKVQYRFNKYHSAGLTASLQYIPLTKGNTRDKGIDKDGNIIREQEWSAPQINGGGTSRLIWTLGVNYSFSL